MVSLRLEGPELFSSIYRVRFPELVPCASMLKLALEVVLSMIGGCSRRPIFAIYFGSSIVGEMIQIMMQEMIWEMRLEGVS
jgi:hypothetical protein